ncbi:MAG: hypothetical protein JW807_15340 [Spirochaetes bacterium]|nr:hypothetical protein [Spirochaetota bacterium]
MTSTKKTIQAAYKNKGPIVVGFKNGDAGIYTVTKYNTDEDSWSYSLELLDVKGGSDKKISVMSSDLGFAFPFNPQKKGTLIYTGGNTIPIECVIKGVKSSIIETSSDDKFEIKLVDGSQIVGEVAGINLKTGELLVKTRVKLFNLPPDVIESIITPKLEVNVILIDGSQRKGTLIKDDADGIVIKTILGEETYPRHKVHKIVYQK